MDTRTSLSAQAFKCRPTVNLRHSSHLLDVSPHPQNAREGKLPDLKGTLITEDSCLAPCDRHVPLCLLIKNPFLGQNVFFGFFYVPTHLFRVTEKPADLLTFFSSDAGLPSGHARRCVLRSYTLRYPAQDLADPFSSRRAAVRDYHPFRPDLSWQLPPCDSPHFPATTGDELLQYSPPIFATGKQ